MSSAIRDLIRRYGKADGFDNISTYPDAELDLWIADAMDDVSESRLGKRYNRGVAYMACHLMYKASSSVSSGGGGIKKEKTRNVETEYQQVSGDDIKGSKYYDSYLGLLKNKKRAGPMVLNGRAD